MTYPVDENEYKRLLAHRIRRADKDVSVTVPEGAEVVEAPPEPEEEVRESLKVQALLAEIGSRMGMQIWIPKSDRAAVLTEWWGDHPPVLERLPLNYDDTTLRTIEQIDVLWLKGRAIKRAFEVEHTTSIYSGILRMADLLALQPNMDSAFTSWRQSHGGRRSFRSCAGLSSPYLIGDRLRRAAHSFHTTACASSRSNHTFRTSPKVFRMSTKRSPKGRPANNRLQRTALRAAAEPERWAANHDTLGDVLMNVAVLGSGNGGCAIAFDCATQQHTVRLFDFDHFPDNIRKIQQQGGLYAEGALSGFAPIDYAGHDIGYVVRDADIIYVVGPAYSTRSFAEVCRPHLHRGHIVIVCPGSCMGSIEFKHGAGLGLRDEDVVVAETSTLPYAVRLVEPGRMHVFLKVTGGLFVSGVPACTTYQVIENIRAMHPMIAPAKNVFQTSLQNGNPVIHPAITVLNTALIERTKGDFLFYEEGVTPAVGRLIKAIDEERIAIGRALNIEIIPEPVLGHMQGYMAEASYDRGYAEAPGFCGIQAQQSLEYRYFHEDVGYGLVFWQSLAEQIGVATPCIAALIRLVSVLMGRDYRQEGKRTMASLGLAGYTMDELAQLLA